MLLETSLSNGLVDGIIPTTEITVLMTVIYDMS